MGIWLRNLEQMRSGIEFSKSWLWDIQFKPGPVATELPANFQSWFPATNVEENLTTLETHDFKGGFSTLSIPKGTTLFDLKITFIDDIFLSIQKWVDNWVNIEILGGGEHIACLESSVKIVNIAKYTGTNELVSLHSYYVFPKGALFYSGNSENNFHSSELEFVIAGTKSKKQYAASKTETGRNR